MSMLLSKTIWDVLDVLSRATRDEFTIDIIPSLEFRLSLPLRTIELVSKRFDRHSSSIVKEWGNGKSVGLDGWLDVICGEGIKP